ncbi:DUF4252 domain-containing protein [candidate division KSB1 bacterium]|nr:DUF4252 domain-containing protein [candidate division KSB1 bacterium]
MKTIIIFLLAGLSGVLYAQDSDYLEHPGYIDFRDFLNFNPEDAKTEIEISNPLLSIVADASKDEDQELSSFLKGLKLIKVYSFEIDSNQVRDIKSQIDRIDSKMQKQHWNRFVRVREKDEVTNIYLKSVDKTIVGLTLLSVNCTETVFINIVGHINLDSVSKLGTKFNIPQLDSVKVQ